jgi:hypothetical protein
LHQKFVSHGFYDEHLEFVAHQQNIHIDIILHLDAVHSLKPHCSATVLPAGYNLKTNKQMKQELNTEHAHERFEVYADNETIRIKTTLGLQILFHDRTLNKL